MPLVPVSRKSMKQNNTPDVVNNLTVAVVQMVSSMSLEDNLQQAAKLIAKAVAQNAKLVLLPENCFMFSASRFLALASDESVSGLIEHFLAEQSSKYGIFLVAGSVPVLTENNKKVYSTTLVYSPEGGQVATYYKMHLFDVDVGDNVGVYRESAHIEAGKDVMYFDCFGHRVGLSICYDLRFPELYRDLSNQGCELLLVPSAFTAKTGEKHWEILLRARAIENQCFVLAANQGGQHHGEQGAVRYTWGHSMIVDADGKILEQLELGEGVCVARLDFEQLHQLRRAMPVLQHRRL